MHTMLDPRRRVRAWLGASIGNRMTAALVALAFAVMLVTGAINFAYLYAAAMRTAQADVESKTDDVAGHLGHELDEIAEDGRVLSRNPTVVSGARAAPGQGGDLSSLLKSAQRSDALQLRDVCVTDGRGRALSCMNGTMPSHAGAAWLDDVLRDARPHAVVRRDADDTTLVLVQPVLPAGTGPVEGLIVSEFDLPRLLRHAIGDPRRYGSVAVHDAQGELIALGTGDSSIHAERPLALRSAYAPLDLRVRTGVDRRTVAAQLLGPTLLYVASVPIVALGLLLAVRRIVPRLASPLRALAAQADHVASGGAWTMAPGDARTDEIGQLTRSFAVMVERLQRVNASLERQVVARTHALHRQKALLVSILDATPGVVFRLRRSPEGRFGLPFASAALERLHGIAPDTVRDDVGPILRRLHDGDRKALGASLAVSLARGEPSDAECRFVDGHGAPRWIAIHRSAPKREADGSIVWHGFAMEITARKRTELSLAQSEAYNKALFEASYIPIVVMDPRTGAFVDGNDAAVRIYGMGGRSELIGATPADVSDATQYDGTPSAQASVDHIRAALADGTHVFEWRHRRPHGELWDGEVRLMRVTVGSQELLHFALRDITEHKRSAAKVWRRANFDALTGLANRGLLNDRLERAIAQARRRGQRVGVLFVDLDRFKTINDTLGHAAGDELLVEAAKRLASVVRDQDTVARIGGDEFVLVLKDIARKADLRRAAEATVARLDAPFALSAGTGRVSASVGIAMFPDDATTPDGLLRDADAALYAAKRGGRNHYRFHASPHGKD